MRTSLIRRILSLALILCMASAALPVFADTDYTQTYPSYIYPGALVYFGFYEQDNNPRNGAEPVQWEVLDVNYTNGFVLLLSHRAIEMQRFNPKWVKVNWRDCGLRAFLNDEFYFNCFSRYEQQAIVPTMLKSGYVSSSVETVDKVFCLDSNEVKRYLPTNAQRLGYPTPYALGREVAVFDGGTCYWWLRDTTKRQNDANHIKPDGSVETYGLNTNAYGVGVRPAVWVRLDYFPTY